MTPACKGDHRNGGGPERLHLEVGNALGQLTPVEERVLRRRFGVGEARRDIDCIGEELGLTRSHVRELQRRALQKLRAAALEDSTPVCAATRPGPAVARQPHARNATSPPATVPTARRERSTLRVAGSPDLTDT